jgi:hypothetical protein
MADFEEENRPEGYPCEKCENGDIVINDEKKWECNICGYKPPSPFETGDIVICGDFPRKEEFSNFPEGSFPAKLIELINEYSLEGASDTPAYILGEYLIKCMDAFSVCTNERDKWHGFPTKKRGGK